MVNPDELAAAIARFLPAQRWFGAKNHSISELKVAKIEVLQHEWPALVRAEVDVDTSDGETGRYQVLMGLRPVEEACEFLDGKPAANIAALNTDAGQARAYEALVDPALALRLLDLVFPQAGGAATVRPVGVEQSNSSVIYDERLILKVFRKLLPEPNLDVETTEALGRAGFTHVAAPIGVWRSEGTDLAILQPYLGGVDGWALSLTSLRDVYDRGGDPALAGGDFAAESARLGETIAELHIAMASTFGTGRGEPERWAAEMNGQLDRIRHPELDPSRARQVFESLAAVPDPGPSIRVHGDLHLGQVLRTDSGWVVLDFEGEPNRPPEERRRPTSPLKDVAGMLRSIDYAAISAMRERGDDQTALAQTWAERNRRAFLKGYLRAARTEGHILPTDNDSLELVMKAFELDRAIYELGYELANRPDWAGIPLRAISKLY
jgi:maltokinase